MKWQLLHRICLLLIINKSIMSELKLDPLVVSSIPEQRQYEDDDNQVYPLTLSPSQDNVRSSVSLTQWISANQSTLDKLLLEHKAILFRGFDVSNAQDFHDVIEATGYEPMDYIGGAAVRTQLTNRVFTANESPPSEKIPFHHEMAQTPLPPTHLFFFCETEPTTGGETPILPSPYIAEKMYQTHSAFMDKIETLGLKYVRILPMEDDHSSAIGRGWMSTFQTDTKEGAEAALTVLGSSWEWLPDGCLKTITATLPGIRVDEGANRSNKKTFFNSIVAAYAGWNDVRNVGERSVVFGDGSYCDKNVMADALRIMEEKSVAFKWRKGDVLLLDNRLNLHSRKPFTGPRRILAGIARDSKR